METYCRVLSLTYPRPTSIAIAAQMRAKFALDSILPDDVRKFWQRRLDLSGEDKPVAATGPLAVPGAPKSFRINFQPYWDRYKNLVQGTAWKEKRPLGERKSELCRGQKTILVLSDIHLPFHDPAYLDRVYSDNPPSSVDAIFLLGDTTNFDSVSKYSNYMYPEDEAVLKDVETKLALSEELDAIFPGKPVLELDGNHVLRVSKRIAEHLDPMLIQVVTTRFNHAMARPFPNHYAIESWYALIGKTCFAHGEKRVGGVSWRKNAELFYQYFVDGAISEGRMPPRLLVQGHVHQLGFHRVYGSYGAVIWAGTLSLTPTYTRYPHMEYGRSQAPGYVRVRLNDGDPVLNECEIISF